MLGVRVLGDLEAEVAGKVIAPSESRRAWALLGWMAVNPGLHPRSVVAATLWPDVLDSSALQSLRSALWSLRRALGPGAAALVTDRERLGLEVGTTTVDLLEFEALTAAGELERAQALWRGPLLAGFEEDWAIRARDEASERLAEVLAALSEQAASADDLPRAVHWARKRAAVEPFSEEAARQVMRRLAESGDRAAALAVYDRLCERLRRELALAPSNETRELARALRSGPPVERSPVPERAIAVRQRRLIRLVGREAELGLLRQAWDAAREGYGGVAIVAGPAGIGKHDQRGAARAVRGVLSPLARRGQAGRAVSRRDLPPRASQRPEGRRDLRLGNRRERPPGADFPCGSVRTSPRRAGSSLAAT